jgi:hypothetical protein
VLNALLMPVVRGYLERLRARLKDAGFTAPVCLVQSNGARCALAESEECLTRCHENADPSWEQEAQIWGCGNFAGISAAQ